ncbi:MAG: hypothetical protein Q7R83_02360 [bacterium]|nr:hypothetical protein [bacterium]
MSTKKTPPPQNPEREARRVAIEARIVEIDDVASTVMDPLQVEALIQEQEMLRDERRIMVLEDEGATEGAVEKARGTMETHRTALLDIHQKIVEQRMARLKRLQNQAEQDLKDTTAELNAHVVQELEGIAPDTIHWKMQGERLAFSKTFHEEYLGLIEAELAGTISLEEGTRRAQEMIADQGLRLQASDIEEKRLENEAAAEATQREEETAKAERARKEAAWKERSAAQHQLLSVLKAEKRKLSFFALKERGLNNLRQDLAMARLRLIDLEERGSPIGEQPKLIAAIARLERDCEGQALTISRDKTAKAEKARAADTRVEKPTAPSARRPS